MTSVVKVGNTVRRATNAWTPTVHRLLKFLEDRGFEGVPRVLGIDSTGREVLSFMDGEAGLFDSCGTVPKNLWSDGVLIQAAKFLRSYHDVTTDFDATPGMHWQFIHPDPERREVISHNDFAPWNSIFLEGRLRAVIDFDNAGPGPRMDDIAHAAYSFVPLFRPEKCRQAGLSAPVDYCRKLELFCDAYGREYCSGIMRAVLTRVQEIADWIVEQAAAGDDRFGRIVRERHVEDYEADVAYMRHYQGRLASWLG